MNTQAARDVGLVGDWSTAPLNRSAGNTDCLCGVEDQECPFTPSGLEIRVPASMAPYADHDLCAVCLYGPGQPQHGPPERCHGVKRNPWTLGESGCGDPAEHHAYRPHEGA